MSVVTNNWGSIQIKSIDPFSDVSSDITSRLTKIIGTDNAYIKGFDIVKIFSDMDYNGIFVQLTSGIGIISNIVIEITQDTTIRVVSFPITVPGDYYIVLEYIYAKTTPPPIATIKGIPASEYDARIHLPLYKINLNGWLSYVSTDIVKIYINDNPNRYIDMRNRTGYIPRTGGTFYSGIFLDERIYEDHKFNNNEYITKNYVVKYIKDSLNELITEQIGINFKCSLLDLLLNCPPVKDVLKQIFMELINENSMLVYDAGFADTIDDDYKYIFDNEFAIVNMISYDYNNEGIYYDSTYGAVVVVHKYNGGYASWLHDCDCTTCFNFEQRIIDFIGTVQDEYNNGFSDDFSNYYAFVPKIYSGGDATTDDTMFTFIYFGGIA